MRKKRVALSPLMLHQLTSVYYSHAEVAPPTSARLTLTETIETYKAARQSSAFVSFPTSRNRILSFDRRQPLTRVQSDEFRHGRC
ncbi:hypothetical protein F2P81_000642 [Scophthalmus maximus]|uniref:Uncharacterized protein n=1 Tax=Scophthalmus maximus TaxID=52904 RepID=A0A6A4TQ41_SCOMX|nr:hypothetical protein F2P81_000642 [Scophthalmus maximus]